MRETIERLDGGSRRERGSLQTELGRIRWGPDAIEITPPEGTTTRLEHGDIATVQISHWHEPRRGLLDHLLGRPGDVAHLLGLQLRIAPGVDTELENRRLSVSAVVRESQVEGIPRQKIEAVEIPEPAVLGLLDTARALGATVSRWERPELDRSEETSPAPRQFTGHRGVGWRWTGLAVAGVGAVLMAVVLSRHLLAARIAALGTIESLWFAGVGILAVGALGIVMGERTLDVRPRLKAVSGWWPRWVPWRPFHSIDDYSRVRIRQLSSVDPSEGATLRFEVVLWASDDALAVAGPYPRERTAHDAARELAAAFDLRYDPEVVIPDSAEAQRGRPMRFFKGFVLIVWILLTGWIGILAANTSLEWATTPHLERRADIAYRLAHGAVHWRGGSTLTVANHRHASTIDVSRDGERPFHTSTHPELPTALRFGVHGRWLFGLGLDTLEGVDLQSGESFAVDLPGAARFPDVALPPSMRLGRGPWGAPEHLWKEMVRATASGRSTRRWIVRPDVFRDVCLAGDGTIRVVVHLGPTTEERSDAPATEVQSSSEEAMVYSAPIEAVANGRTRDWHAQQLPIAHRDSVLALSPDCRWLADVPPGDTTDGVVHPLDLTETDRAVPLHDPPAATRSVRFSSDGSHVVAISEGARAIVWSVDMDRRVETSGVVADFAIAADPGAGVALSPEGRWLVVVDTERPRSRFRDDPAYLEPRPRQRDVRDHVLVYDVQSGEIVRRFYEQARESPLAISRDGRFLATVADGARRVDVWRMP